MSIKQAILSGDWGDRGASQWLVPWSVTADALVSLIKKQGQKMQNITKGPMERSGLGEKERSKFQSHAWLSHCLLKCYGGGLINVRFSLAVVHSSHRSDRLHNGPVYRTRLIKDWCVFIHIEHVFWQIPWPFVDGASDTHKQKSLSCLNKFGLVLLIWLSGSDL